MGVRSKREKEQDDKRGRAEFVLARSTSRQRHLPIPNADKQNSPLCALCAVYKVRDQCWEERGVLTKR